MTSLLGVEALLKAAKYLDNLNDTDQLCNGLHENAKTFPIDEKQPLPKDSMHHFIAIDEKIPEKSRNIVDVLPCISSTVPSAYNINETLNLSTDSSGYITSNNISATSSSLINNADDSEIEKSFEDQKALNKPISQSEFSATTTPNSLSHVRRRTVSSNSSSNLRSPSTVRAGTREVHNKLEKNRRAHLKECFEALKKQLPPTPDEKKASNLSILGAAIRHIQSLKRKEREYEHEMERLAKDKIAAQNRILCLKRELQQWDIDYSKLFHEYVEVNGFEKSDGEAVHLIDQTSRVNATYSPSFRFGSDLNNSSESSKGTSIPTQRIVGISQVIPVPTKKISMSEDPQSSLKPIGITSSTPENGPIQPALSYRQNQKTNAKISENSIQKVPLNLHANGSLSELSNITKNGAKVSNGYDLKSMTKSTTTVYNNIPNNLSTSQQSSLISSSSTKSEQIEPPTKLIKLIGSNAILAPIDSDNNKIMHSGHITLQQVVGSNGLVMSPIQLVTSSQSLKVIGQPNGLTTIELNPAMKGHPKNNIRSQFTNHMPHSGLQKLLINNNGLASSSPGSLSSMNIPSINQHGHNGNIKQITPGGAELNILPSSSTGGNSSIYQNQGKLAIVKEINSGNRLHVMQSAPNSVVSTSQNVNFVNTTSQISGKLILSNQSPMNPNSVKSMFLLNHGNTCEKNPSVNTGEVIQNNL